MFNAHRTVSVLTYNDVKAIRRRKTKRLSWLIVPVVLIILDLANAGSAKGESSATNGPLVWDSEMKSTNVPAGQNLAHFVFNFTNISAGDVTIINVKPSCGCTTAQIPKLPWLVAAGTNGQIGITVNLAGKSGTLVKTVRVSSDKSTDVLMAQITITPLPGMSEVQRMDNLKVAMANRQAIFHGDCATCHVVPGEGKSGKALYEAVCGICHVSEHRATMVPDLHHLTVPTNADFWRAWISHGQTGTLMPAFSIKEGGPLTDAQIASLVNFLTVTYSTKGSLAPAYRPQP
jgi:mono/diheme cytochrome c family protein